MIRWENIINLDNYVLLKKQDREFRLENTHGNTMNSQEKKSVEHWINQSRLLIQDMDDQGQIILLWIHYVKKGSTAGKSGKKKRANKVDGFN